MIQELIFLFFAAFSFSFAVLAVTLKNLFHAAFCFAAMLFGVSGIFIFLGSEFLAVVQILVYLGAIAVLIIFALMLSPPQFLETQKKPAWKLFFSLSIALSLLVLLGAFLLKRSSFQEVASAPPTLKKLGQEVLTHFVLPFEVIALVLLVAIVGAVILAWEGPKR